MPSHHRGSAAERRALDAYVKLIRCSETLVAALAPTISSRGLTMAQFTVLEVLLHRGPLPVGEISRKVLRSHGNICTVVDNLEKLGLVTREPNLEDRRSVRVSLTPAGQDQIEATFSVHATEVREAFSALEPGEQETLGLLCRKLGRARSAAIPE